MKLKYLSHCHAVAVHVWTINEASEMDRLLDLGVDGSASDTPTPLVQRLKERGCVGRSVLGLAAPAVGPLAVVGLLLCA
jgi:hypothetical protein